MAILSYLTRLASPSPPPRTEFIFSPNGAMTYQPRAKRRAALGCIATWTLALKGRPMGGAGRGDGSPLQGLSASPTPTQGDALGWYMAAPLGLTTYGIGVLGYSLPPSGLGMGSDGL